MDFLFSVIFLILYRPLLSFCFLLAYYLHEKFQWIGRELALLQNRIDRANEKGWRREYPFLIYLVIGESVVWHLRRGYNSL